MKFLPAFFFFFFLVFSQKEKKSSLLNRVHKIANLCITVTLKTITTRALNIIMK